MIQQTVNFLGGLYEVFGPGVVLVAALPGLLFIVAGILSAGLRRLGGRR